MSFVGPYSYYLLTVSGCVSTNRGSTITLFDNSYKCHESYSDGDGRLSAVVIENEKLELLLILPDLTFLRSF